jgi:hypothetical protein
VQAPIIVTFHAPAHPAYDFRRFYEGAKARGFMLYPGKLTQVETFRVGCIGAIGRNEMRQAVEPGHRGGRHAEGNGHSPTATPGALPSGFPRPHDPSGPAPWPCNPKEHPALAAVRKRGAGKVKVAVSDIDGILRGKYLHIATSSSAAPRAASASATWSSAGTRTTVCYDNTTVTGWQHGFPDALARLDLDTARHVPWDGNVPFFLGDFVNADGSPFPCARGRRSSAC